MPLLLQQANAARIQGTALNDGAGSPVNRFLTDFTQTNEPNFGTRRVLVGSWVQVFRQRNHGGKRGPGGMYQHSWNSNTRFCDDTLFTLVQRITARNVPVTMHTSLLDVEFFSGDASTTEFFPFRQILSSGYSQSGTTGLGEQSGSTAASFAILNAGTGAAWGTVVYDRTLQMLDFAGLAADVDTVTVTVDGTATVLTAVAGVPGANEFRCITTDEVSATNLATAIDGITGVSASSSGTDTVTVVKDTDTITVTLATSDDATDLAIHPIGTEVAIDTTGPDPWRNLVFATAPADALAMIEINYHALYNVTAHMTQAAFPGGRDGTQVTSYGLNMQEKGAL